MMSRRLPWFVTRMVWPGHALARCCSDREEFVSERGPGLCLEPGLQQFGGRISFPHPEKNESFFLLKWGVQILYIFNEKQTPRFDSANLEPSEPIFCPQILEPRLDRISPADLVDHTARRHLWGALRCCQPLQLQNQDRRHRCS